MPQFGQAEIERVKALFNQEGRSKFDVGDEIVRLIPWGRDGEHNGSKEDMEEMAERTGEAFSTIKDRRQASALVPPTERSVAVYWSVYFEITKYDELTRQKFLRLVRTEKPDTKSGRWTVNAIRLLKGKKGMGRKSDPLTERIGDSTAEEKIAAAALLMADPDVTEAMASDPEGEVSAAFDAMADKVTEIRLEQAGEPTISVKEMKKRLKKGKDESIPYQHSRFAVVLSGFFLKYTPEAVAEAILGNPASQRLDVYVEQANRAIAWFSAFRSALQEGRRPRLIPVEDAS